MFFFNTTASAAAAARQLPCSGHYFFADPLRWPPPFYKELKIFTLISNKSFLGLGPFYVTVRFPPTTEGTAFQFSCVKFNRLILDDGIAGPIGLVFDFIYTVSLLFFSSWLVSSDGWRRWRRSFIREHQPGFVLVED